MKYFVVACALFAVALAAPQEHHHHDHADVHGMKAVHEKCQNDPATHLETSVLEDLRKNRNNAQLPPNFGLHVQCMSKGMNLIQEDGKVNVEGVKTHVGHVEKDQSKADSIVQECAQNKENEKETSKHVWECLHKNHIFSGPHHHHHSDESSASSESEEHHHH
ncbi:uncharacterized protein LOC126742967 [Anthonomus grandis grandis]|uniref:uncharacterized protein LOC126742967 n=1 Tax=Anthonomus grandis grandis TaxID=2921223 RepID=UPI002165A65C|nr:uncharacterized protein LOC126742967 [Anthonomus grandis grandis]